MQENGFTFTTLDEFLNSISPQLHAASKMSLRNLLQRENFNERINELANVACLANYGQSIDIDGFVGLV